MHPVLAVDFGSARIGIAATDAAGILAYPVESIHTDREEPLSRIEALVHRLSARTLVVGLPLRLDGTEGSACEKVRAFAARLHERFPEMPLFFQDEFLTTAEAQRKLHAAGRKARSFKPVIDQAAAVEILNSWMRSRGEWCDAPTEPFA